MSCEAAGIEDAWHPLARPGRDRLPRKMMRGIQEACPRNHRRIFLIGPRPLERMGVEPAVLRPGDGYMRDEPLRDSATICASDSGIRRRRSAVPPGIPIITLAPDFAQYS